MQEWKEVKVGDICTVGRGSSPRPINDQKYFEGGSIPWIKIADATKSGKYLYETKQYVNEYGASFSRLLPKGALIVAASGTLGYTQRLGVKGCIHDGWLYLDDFNDNVDVDFIFYLMKYKVQYFYNSAYGAAIQNVNTSILKEMDFLLPPYEEQQKIASILSAFDDLIENNTRRIAILEEMARFIYREWFVHYRYPGHENYRLVDSGTELGEVPEGWDISEAQEFINFNPRTSIEKDLERPYLPMGGVSENSMVIDDSEVELRIGGSGTKFQNLDTLFARITPSLENGKTGFVQFLKEGQIALGSTEFVVMRSKKLNPYYVYCLARDDQFRETAIKSMAGASGRQRVRVNSIKEYKLPMPSEKVLDDFGRTVKPMFEQIHKLKEHNKKLKATRDLLLPKLISGKVGV